MGAKSKLPRVLVVDDQPVLLAIMRRELQARFEVDTAAGGAEAIEMIRRDDGYALILCDLVMPDVSGFEVIEVLARETPAVLERLVAMSGGLCTPAEHRRFAAFGVHVLHKPFGSNDLLMLALSYLARRTA